MSQANDSLTVLGQVAPVFGANWSQDGKLATAFLPIIRPSGARIEFGLDIGAVGQAVVVRERLPRRLPAFCPDRHINPDGSFCLGWGDDSPAQVADEAGARRWWAAVDAFLRLQLLANESHVWSNGSLDWAHGDAAKYQSIAEEIAAEFGSRFRRDLDQQRLTVTQQSHARGTRIRLLRDRCEIAMVSSSGILRDTRISCPCDASAGSISGCADHAEKLASFTLALATWQLSEKNFMRELAAGNAVCCGTLENCALRDELKARQVRVEERRRHVRRHRPRRRPSF